MNKETKKRNWIQTFRIQEVIIKGISKACVFLIILLNTLWQISSPGINQTWEVISFIFKLLLETNLWPTLVLVLVSGHLSSCPNFNFYPISGILSEACVNFRLLANSIDYVLRSCKWIFETFSNHLGEHWRKLHHSERTLDIDYNYLK